ncbi:undecaprenyl/decaprenyl-phosphate alpha-N-acetylglucosaminyl 1-phosphate transferase [bacterium]|nr:undecaprenyl/decaprenyl-phosphate alpha-N-acetylglucosaminyl 1-phosphate transferase [bacterium]
MIPTTGILAAALAALVLTALCSPLAIKLGHRYNLLDQPGKHKRHRQPTPALGGTVLFVAFWVTVGLLLVLFPRALEELHGVLGYIFAAALIILLVGLSDDLSPVSAWVKLLAQVAAGLVLYLGGMSIDPLTIPFYGPVETGAAGALITVVWVVALTNAINLLDGLDLLAGGVSLIATLVLIAVGALLQVGTVVLLGIALAGFLTIFLWFNRPPARLFLGDSGSLQIGFYFAVLSLLVPIRSYTAAALYVPLLTLGVPLMEAGLSIVRRLAAGRSVMKADRRHLFHLLAIAGWSNAQVVAAFWVMSLVFGGFALSMFYFNRLWVLGFLALFMVVIFVLILILLTNLPKLAHREHPIDPGRSNPSRRGE